MTTAATTPYRYVGRHLDDLADGRLAEPGGMYDLDKDAVIDPHNQRLIDEGLLIPVETFNANPAAVKYAAEHGVSLSDVTATGQGGQITKGDVEAHVKAKEEHAS